MFADIFRSHDLGGFAKFLWVIFVIFLPYLGVFVYLIARGHKMSEHAMAGGQAQDAAQRAYIQRRGRQRHRARPTSWRGSPTSRPRASSTTPSSSKLKAKVVG